MRPSFSDRVSRNATNMVQNSWAHYEAKKGDLIQIGLHSPLIFNTLIWVQQNYLFNPQTESIDVGSLVCPMYCWTEKTDWIVTSHQIEKFCSYGDQLNAKPYTYLQLVIVYLRRTCVWPLSSSVVRLGTYIPELRVSLPTAMWTLCIAQKQSRHSFSLHCLVLPLWIKQVPAPQKLLMPTILAQICTKIFLTIPFDSDPKGSNNWCSCFWHRWSDSKKFSFLTICSSLWANLSTTYPKFTNSRFTLVNEKLDISYISLATSSIFPKIALPPMILFVNPGLYRFLFLTK